MIVGLFNWVHILVILTIPVFIVASYFALRNKEQKTKDIYMWIVLGVLVASYLTTFTVACIINEEHRATILKQLPLHMCRINVFLYPVCFALRNRNKLFKRVSSGYMFFVGSPAALLATFMPPGNMQNPDIVGSSLFKYNVLIYFIMHNIIIIFPILLVALKYYQPKAFDMVYSAGALMVLLCVIHVINLILSSIGGYLVNYFYTRFADNILLDVFWKLIPVELLYMLPLIVVLVPIFAIYYFSSKIPYYIKRVKERKKEAK